MKRPAALAVMCGLACTLTVFSCTEGGGNSNPPLPPGGGGGSGAIGPPPPPPSGNVIIQVEAPTSDLVAPAGSLVDVRVNASIDQGNDFIVPTSVKAVVTLTGETQELESTQLAPEGLSIFAGRISLGDLATGTYTLTVTAVSSGGMLGSASVDFQIDGGPTLIVRSPQAMRPYKGLLVIEVVADPGPFGPLDGPYATVANYPITLEQLADPPNTYRGMLDLDDPRPPMILPELINEQLLTVWATNANGKRVERHLIFTIDKRGPLITQTTPVPGQIMGNVIRISATVTDEAAVLDSSVIAVIGDDTRPALFNVSLKPDGAGSYSVLFDTKKLTQCPDPPIGNQLCVVFPTISFRASDELGNETVVSYDFALDNIAPVSDLDPPNLRSMKLDAGIFCSWEFDPLGVNVFEGDMPNDRTRVPQVFDLRARIEDDGNHAAGLKLPPISLVDPQKTSVYVLDDETQPLIVDIDGDGWCDRINPTLVPTTQPPTTNNQVLQVRLAPVEPDGAANFRPDPSIPATQFSPCARGIDPAPPPALCHLQPSIAIGYREGEPAIWTVEPVDKPHCFGNQFDTFANNIHEGWACIAVESTDGNGNVGVSPPLRVFIDYRYTGAFGVIEGGAAPACTGSYDRVTGAVANGACKTRRFERQPDFSDYYCFGTDCPAPFTPLNP